MGVRATGSRDLVRGVEYGQKKEYKIENLTMLQMQYLIELNKLEKKKGAVRMIAAKCGVNHSQVSRFFEKMYRRRRTDRESGFHGKWEKKIRLALQDDAGCP